jgi:glycosyltransferase involved in cell wall biosynthesis
MNVLYIDGVGAWGGASRSLYEALNNLNDDSINKYFIIVRGTVVKKYNVLSKDTIICYGLTRFDNTQYSYYRGVRWIVLLREIFHLPFTFYGLFKAWYKWRDKIDLIHVNEITEIVPLLIAKFFFKKPIVCHVRSVARLNQLSFRSKLINFCLTKYVEIIIAIDENVKSSLNINSNKIITIHNSFTPNNNLDIDIALRKKIEQLKNEVFKLGFVGNLLFSKGIYDLVLAVKTIVDDGYKINVIIVGDDARKNSSFFNRVLKIMGIRQDMKSEILDLIKKMNLQDNFIFLGSTFDIQAIYKFIDVNCFPSHFNAPGRPVFEAAFFKVPSIVSVSNPKEDTLIHMETGFAIKGKDPEDLYNAIKYYLNNPAEKNRMGINAYKLADINFNATTNSQKLRNLYYDLINN